MLLSATNLAPFYLWKGGTFLTKKFWIQFKLHKVGILKQFELLTAKSRVNANSFIKDFNFILLKLKLFT